ncbi:zinc finger matrin-type protein 1 isoform X3 [Xiphias gladius]|uniref:zinc finger matrin-type protein 1 isoform X3 n=1 Tax=Xiphias gladius TaxID=8245 RepID=UPI001A9A1A5A|nr:zinc finger matrin-type protein 1 isoform X3 [Xiphias gladius]
MDDTIVCSPQLAESDAQNNTTSTPNAASVTDADKVINTKIDSTQVEGDKNEEELLKGLLTDNYCHVCEAVLLFESQRLSHYEGKKHAQKLKLYLQARKAEKMKRETTVRQRTIPNDKDRFCELCNMVFSSHLVAKSHYEGKVHAKNLRKQGLQPPVINRYTMVCTLPRLPQDPDNADQKSAPEGGMEHLMDTAASTTIPSTEVDLRDPNKYCALCAASFNNPQMALQHYNGRKHQRNQARQELIKELGDDVQQDSRKRKYQHLPSATPQDRHTLTRWRPDKMIPLPLAWTLLTVSLWTVGSSQILLQEPVKVLYPKISSQETIECDCVNPSCESVFWFHTNPGHDKVQFLGKHNNADRVTYGAGVSETKFKFRKSGSMSFELSIQGVKEEDTGIYSCVLKGKSNTDTWKPGILLRPGVTPPTSPPKTKPKPPVKSICRCPKKTPSQNGCGSLVLWPLVGLTAVLALALICTLYYFSRLPKKCRHHFAKKRQTP